jgi:hypothetical protein
MAWPGNGWRPQHGERSALGNDLFYRPDPCTIRTKQMTVYGYVTLAGDWLECGVLLASHVLPSDDHQLAALGA